ncbi:MAG: hydrogenase maturation nickel metallochaperone HypA [Candidatus Edwardsbacteria bacterium]
MHELAITDSILKIALSEAEKAGAKRILTIHLKIGEMTTYVPDSVRFYFGILSKGTMAEAAELRIDSLPLLASCKKCAQKFQVKNYRFVCSFCSSTELEIISGRELFIESLEVEKEELLPHL